MEEYDRRPSTIELELESVRKFSLLDCIRNEVKQKINCLPKYYREYLRGQIDDVIELNLLNERKVRFASMRDVCNDHFEKRALNEIEILLQVLGNDRKNKLIIDHFDLLENRIKSVEQRLMAHLRRAPNSHAKKIPTIKIDPVRIRKNIQDFVNKFNNVFSSTYGILTSSIENGTLIDETLSSKNRLKFHLISRLTELRHENAYAENMLGMRLNKKTDFNKNNSIKKSIKGGSKVKPIMAVDSLITLRKRAKKRSVKKKIDLEGKKDHKQRQEKLNPNIKRKDESKFPKKKSQQSSCEQSSTPGSIDDNFDFDILDELSNLSYHSVCSPLGEEAKRKTFNKIADMTASWPETFENGKTNREANTEKALPKVEPKIIQNDTLKKKFYKNANNNFPNRTFQINKDLRSSQINNDQQVNDKELAKRNFASNYNNNNNEKNFDLSHRKRYKEESGDYFNNNASPDEYINKDCYDNRADGTNIDVLKAKPKPLIIPSKSFKTSLDCERNEKTTSKHSSRRHSSSSSWPKETQNRHSRKADKNNNSNNKGKSHVSSKYANEVRLRALEKNRDKKKTVADTFLRNSIPHTRRKLAERNFRQSLEALFKRTLSVSSITSLRNSSRSILSSDSY